MKSVFQTLRSWWMAFAHALGWVNTRVLLSVVYIVIIGIPAIVMKIIRKDLLDRKFGSRATYWTPKETTPHTREQAEHQF